LNYAYFERVHYIKLIGYLNREEGDTIGDKLPRNLYDYYTCDLCNLHYRLRKLGLCSP